MADGRSLWLLLPRQVRTLPADLAAILAVTALVNVAVFAPVIRETPLRVPLGLAFVLFIPGYAFIAALFPEDGDGPATADVVDSDGDESEDAQRWTVTNRSGIDGIERVALAFGLSIAIVPLIGLVLNFTPWGIRLVPIMISVSAFTIVTTAIAAVRRRQLPEDERFHVPYREWLAAGRAEVLEPDSRADTVLNVLLVLSIVLAVGTLTYAVVVPPEGEQFSAVYILTEDDDGDLVADGYPTEFVQGESEEIIVGVDNHEHRTVDYTVVVIEQDVEVVDNETVVHEQRELDRFEAQLEHNETWHHEHDLEPTMVGEDNRILWLLYPDEVPEDLSQESTEYHVHLWVDVAEPDED
ncbi:DUF1616 domain-containing protein [Natrialbaceae archaeon AArc-T1-2]|uniref:DUF1616 domain-containing protein n=1 Tax=Natrialbaceae archaeon AArc-T1-2 TaxID=3053904 RepID=UPI00255AF3BA|nr:DUF1616 domain-containing protein [Natrialbaceae archaeon AArc-T1-2]WIV68855.1 DUF1616 domain-containing protein [Natrialbaceae archaeon AArc-T1-2]